jgi:hypothetical protein
MKPVINVSVGGAPVSSAFYSRLLTATVTDQEGHKADTCRFEFADDPPAAIPNRGSIMTVAMGYEAPVFMGAFTVDEVEVECFPFKMSVSGKSADIRKEMKTNKERHWDQKTVQDVISEIAGEHGLSPAISGAVGSHLYEWLGQQDESDLHFLERLARRHNALFAVKNGRLVFAERGSGLSVSGLSLGGTVITPDKIITGSCRVQFKDRSQYKDVVAYFDDKDKAERVELKVQSDPQGAATYRLGEPFGSQAEAEKAANSKARDLKRGIDRVTVTVVGDPAIRAGGPLSFAGVRPGVDGLPFIIETAKHVFSKSQGYRTQITATGQT